MAVLTDDLKHNFDGPILKWFSENSAIGMHTNT